MPNLSSWQLHIIQEFCDGGSLQDAIMSGRFLERRTPHAPNVLHVLCVAVDLAHGMAFL